MGAPQSSRAQRPQGVGASRPHPIRRAQRHSLPSSASTVFALRDWFLVGGGTPPLLGTP